MTQNGPKNFLVAEWVDVLLRYGVGKERGVLTLRLETSFECCALSWVSQRGLSCLSSVLERFLRQDVFGVICLGGVQEVDTQLLFATGATFEVEGLGFVELTSYTGKHAVESDFCHDGSRIKQIKRIFFFVGQQLPTINQQFLLAQNVQKCSQKLFEWDFHLVFELAFEEREVFFMSVLLSEEDTGVGFGG